MCKILDEETVKPHKARHYLERRDPEFADKMAEVLCVYRKVKLLKKAAAAVEEQAERCGRDPPTTRSRDPGGRDDRPDLPPEPGVHPAFAREHEYKRHGTVNLMAGIDLFTGKLHAWSNIAIAAAIHRIPQGPRYSLPGSYGDPPDPRQSFRAYLQGDAGLAYR